MGTLYLVATPIGNLEDITLRALRILKEVSLVAAEDTRSARNLLSHFGINKPITSYFEHSQVSKLNQILDALAGGDVAVISEAGMPGLSDPGYELVCAALEHDYRVVPIPGANALTSALVASGLPTDQFTYVGFLPRQKNARRKFLQSIADEPRTLVAYEAPHRICDSLDDIAETLGNRSICVARELTKVYEEFFRGTVNDARKHFAEHAPRGEFTLAIEGKSDEGRKTEDGKPVWDDARVIQAMRDLIAEDMTRSEAAKRVARESGRDRREVYQLSMTNDK